MTSSNNTIEWFGTTTFRLKVAGLSIFLDSYIERPKVLPEYISIDALDHVDYICISHAHFDHLPGADLIALKTGARVIANGEAINVLRKAGVPEEQLIQVAGGERIPLFTKDVWEHAAKGEAKLEFSIPGAPVRPHYSLAAMSIDVWPSLHCLMTPGEHPDVFDTGSVPQPSDNPFKSTLDITYGMKYFIMNIGKFIPKEARDEKTQSFIDFMEDPKNKFSACDGGQMMYNIKFDGKTILWNAHLGAYQALIKTLDPKPDIAILGAAGEANVDGRPFPGSAAEFLREEVEWLDQPKQVIWCLHDECAMKPFRVDTTAATDLVHEKTSSRVWELQQGKVYELEF